MVLLGYIFQTFEPLAFIFNSKLIHKFIVGYVKKSATIDISKNNIVVETDLAYVKR